MRRLHTTQTIISTEQTLLLPQLLLTLTYTALIAFTLTFPTGRFTPRWTWAVGVYCVVALAFTILPLGVGSAILRYRLWDVDLLINRTLVYGSLTVLLVALYVGLILAWASPWYMP